MFWEVTVKSIWLIVVTQKRHKEQQNKSYLYVLCVNSFMVSPHKLYWSLMDQRIVILNASRDWYEWENWSWRYEKTIMWMCLNYCEVVLVFFIFIYCKSVCIILLCNFVLALSNLKRKIKQVYVSFRCIDDVFQCDS